ncbi:putative ribonuclease H-like domain-containing protein [Tanacetum coccineum]
MYSVDLKNIVPKGGLTCLFAKATSDESKLWHRRLGHINFKTMNKLVKGNLVRGLPSKLFENNQTCVAYRKGKQHRASCKFDGKADEGFFVGYSINIKAFRVFNSRTRIVEENPHVQFRNQSNGNAGTKACDDACKARMETVPSKDYILLPLWNADPPFSQSLKSSPDAGFKPLRDDEKKVTEEPGKEGGDSSKDSESNDQEKEDNVNNTNIVNAASRNEVNVVGAKTSIELLDDPNMPELEDIVYSDNNEDVGAEADMNNLDAFILVSPILTTRIHKDHPFEKIIGDLNLDPQTRRMIKNLEEHEPEKAIHALKDPSWIEAMQEELLQFKLKEVWTLVDLPNGKRPIGTKWVFRNKKNERGIMIKNKMDVKSAFLYGKIEEEVYVCQPPGFEDPDFPDRVYKVKNALFGLHQAPKAWYETLLTYLLDNGFQRGKIDKTLFIRREKGLQVNQKEDGIFISQDKYVTEILKKFGFTNVKTASTPMETQKLLLKDEDGEEVDVDLYRSIIGSMMYLTSSRPDIIFAVCACAKYQVNPKVSHLHDVKRIFRYFKGQLKLGLWYLKDSPFDLVAYIDSDYAGASLDRKSTTGGCQFLGSRLISWDYNEKKLIQMVKIHTDKNVTDLLTKAFDNGIGVNAGDSNLMLLGINLLMLGKVNAARHKLTTAGESTNLLLLGKVNAARHKLTTAVEKPRGSRSRINKIKVLNKLSFKRSYGFHTTVKVKTINGEVQLQALVDGKKIIVTKAFVRRDLQLNDEEGTDYLPNTTIFEELTRMGKRFFRKGNTFVFNNGGAKSSKMGKGSAIPTDPHHTPIQPSTSQPQKKQRSRRPKRKDTEVPQPSGPTDNVADKAVHEERDDSLEMVATTATGLDVEHGKGNIEKTQSKATPNEPSSLETSSGGGPRHQKTIGDTIAQTRFKNVSKFSNDPLLPRVSSDDASLGDQEDASKQRKKIDDIDKDAEITLVDETQGRYGDDIMFDVSDLVGKEVFVAEQGVSDKDVNLSVNEVILAQAVAALKSAKVQEKVNVVEEPSESITTTPTLTTTTVATTITTTSTRPKAKGLVIYEEEQATTPTISSQQPSQAKIQDKGKAKMIKPEPVKKLSKKDQLKLDEEVAQRLQAEFDEQERIEREKAKANIALKETWDDDIHAKIEAGQLLAERLQAREQEELTIEERATLFQQLLEKRRKHFATKRAEEKRNRPPTKAQQRSIMSTYLKNMEGWKPKDLKSKSFANIQELFDKAMKRRAGDELEQESIKKQKVDEDKDTIKFKSLQEVIPDEEEVEVDAIPLATKPPSIVDWKIHKEGNKSYYQIFKANGSSKMYLVFSHMLKSFNKEHLENLYKLVTTKYGSTRLVEDLDLVLYGDLKIMFDLHVEDQVWKNQSDYRVLEWKLYDSCGVHSLRKKNIHIHMLVEKRYPLTPATITDMLNKKLKADHWNEMCYQLLKLITKQSKINEVFGSILLVIMKLLMKKLDDFGDKYQV